MAWKKSQHKHALPDGLKVRQNSGRFSGSGTSHFGQVRTFVDAYLQSNLISPA
jgi:hypothetical protein